MSEELTRSDVMQMIEAAIAALRGRGDLARGTIVPGSREPSIGLDERGNRVITTTFREGATPPPPKEKSVIKLDERGHPFVSTTKIKPQETPAQKHVEMGSGQRQIPDPIGGHKAAGASIDSTRMGTNDVRGLSRETGGRSKEAIADQIKATQEKFKAKAQADQKIIKDADAKFAEAMGNDVTAKVLGVASKEYISRDEVVALINDAVPSTLRHVGRAATSRATGNFLKLENGAQTAAWVDLPAVSGGTDYDLIVIGGRKYTPGAKTTNFLQIGVDGSSSWVAGPIPAVMPTGCEIYDVTKNHIHITGATAGNI